MWWIRATSDISGLNWTNKQSLKQNGRLPNYNSFKLVQRNQEVDFVPLGTLHYEELSKGKVCVTFEVFIQTIQISTFYQNNLILSWSRQRMKHINKTILDEMKSSYFKKWSILIISSFLSCIYIVHCIFLYLNRKKCLTSLPRQEIFG